MYYLSDYTSPLGKITLVGRGDALCGLYIDGQRFSFDGVAEEGETDAILKAKAWLDRYFAGEKPEASELPLAPEGSEFQRLVCRLLCGIPYGELVTYGELAKKIAELKGLERMSAQAVGGAVGRNPISIIIPCHRVIGAGGNLTGYDGGLDKKIWLLRHEGLDLSGMYVPKKGKDREKLLQRFRIDM